MTEAIRVLFTAAEAAPFITAGGLGEVAYALPKALSQLDNGDPKSRVDVRLVIPAYPFVDYTAYSPTKIAEFQINRNSGSETASVLHIRLDNTLDVYLVEGKPIDQAGNTVYAFDAAQDGEKFTFFSLAAVQMAREINWPLDILHANDWHTAPAVYWLAQNRGLAPFYAHTASVLCVHNLPYMGDGAGPAMNDFGLAASTDTQLPKWSREMPLPLGLSTADQIVAVSPGYSQEILTTAFGAGLSEYLNTRAESITGILNGIDTDLWNPAADPTIIQKFDVNSINLRRKNKRALQEMYGLTPDSDSPLITMITRFDHQKGVDLALDALLQIADQPWQAVLMGSGHPDLENAAARLEKILPGRVRALIYYDKDASRQLYAGSDMVLIPSRYEPCGLNQMIAMRYGCIPVARNTGGLRDTIEDYTLSEFSTGFLFQEATPEALAGAVRRALYVFRHPESWNAMQVRGMEKDFSWKNSALQYEKLYRDTLKRFRKEQK